MVQGIDLSNQEGNLFGLRFLQGSLFGQNQEGNKGNSLNGLQNLTQSWRAGNQQNLSSMLGKTQQNQPIQSPRDSVDRNTSQKQEEKDKDRVELSQFAENAAERAVENARKSPQHQNPSQIFVSEDGRFEAAIDLQVKADGSYDMDLSVSFAQSSAAGMSSVHIPPRALPANEQAEDEENVPQEQPRQNAYLGAAASRYTSYEQVLTTRDFQARIFFEEAKSVSMEAGQAYGEEMGQRYQALAGDVSREFRLNVSISGDDIDNFNSVAEQLTQFDESGTLRGFMDAAEGVLQADSSHLGGFVDATQSLITATQEHVSSKLSGFFADMNQNYGGALKEMGFDADYIQTLGQNVEKDLQSFFQVTQNVLQNLFGQNRELENSNENSDYQSIEALRENREQVQEEREKEAEERRAEESVLANEPKASMGTQRINDSVIEDLV